MKPILVLLSALFLFTGCTKRYEAIALIEPATSGELESSGLILFLKSELPSSFKIIRVRDTSLIGISASSDTPDSAAQIVNEALFKLQKTTRERFPDNTFIIWEKAEPPTKARYW